MLDRASTFADRDVNKLLQTAFIPVAIDQFAQRQQRDAEGEFWRKIAGQGPRNDFDDTTQGFYIATAGGELLGFNNRRGADSIAQLMRAALKRLENDAGAEPSELSADQTDPRFFHQTPPGVTVIRVHAKVLGGYATSDDPRREIFQNAISRDNLWITVEERRQLIDGRFPDSLARRIVRFHLVDNTRGEPTFWRENEVKEAKFTLSPEGRIIGKIAVQRGDDSSGYEADLLGFLTTVDGVITRFDLVAKGSYWGAGRYTRRPPKGKFPLGVSFRLVDGSSPYDQIRPQGTKGSWRNYIDLERRR